MVPECAPYGTIHIGTDYGKRVLGDGVSTSHGQNPGFSRTPYNSRFRCVAYQEALTTQKKPTTLYQYQSPPEISAQVGRPRAVQPFRAGTIAYLVRRIREYTNAAVSSKHAI